ncbi:MAG: ATP-binding protein [Pseudomonadota bacterium]|nr:ATP-binding protein [Pseudomonadota bacterium]
MTDDPSAPPEPPAAPNLSVLDAAARNDRRLFESLNEGVWERDLATHEVWYSPRYKALLGFADDELPNLLDAVRERVHPDDLQGVRAAFAVASTSAEIGECQARVRCQDDTYRWFRGRFKVWPDEAHGRPGTLVGSIYDVHEQVLATEALKAQQAVLEERVLERTRGLEAALQLAESQRLAAEEASQAKESFLTHMSHELRTPLNGVLGMTQLAHDLALGAEQRRYLELAQQAGKTLLTILDEVLDFARGGSGRLQLREEGVDLAGLAAEALRSFMPTVRRKGLQVGFDVVGEIARVRADAGRLRQIIGNLLGNAIKYTETGRILLRVEIQASGGDRCKVRLRVRDTGVGLDAATATRIFEPFEQGDSGMDRRYGGAGLGLSVARTLAHLMGGEVSVRSRPGIGSEFRVELDLAVDPSQPEPMPALGSGLVWVVLRDPVHGPGLAERIERLGWRTEVMTSVDAALRRLEGGPGRSAPDCVVIGEDSLDPRTDFARLRRGLGERVPLTLLLRPDFDLATIHAATEQSGVLVAIAPLTPSDLRRLVRPEPAAAGPKTPSPPIPAPPEASVLVVEDNPLNQIIAREMVAALGLRSAVVGSGEEALDSCCSTPPDLVLMDIQMPGMDGLETTRRLRALQTSGHLRPFPIIALTAHGMAADRQASLAAGMDEHLTKPVQLEQLRHVLTHWLSGPENPRVAAPQPWSGGDGGHAHEV